MLTFKKINQQLKNIYSTYTQVHWQWSRHNLMNGVKELALYLDGATNLL